MLNLKPKFEVKYQGKMFEIVNWEGKPGVIFEAVLRAPGVRLIIETEKDNARALLLTKEIRREAEGIDFRLPGGKVFDSLVEFNAHRESGDDIMQFALSSAKKEGKEEAGILDGDFIFLGVSKAGSSVEWDLYYFKVTNSILGQQELTDHEKGDIEAVVLSGPEIFEKLTSGQIGEGRSAEYLYRWLYENNFISLK